MSELPQATSRRELRLRDAAARDRARRGKRRGVGQGFGRAILSFSTMLFVIALAIGLSVPASVFSMSSSAQAVGVATTGTDAQVDAPATRQKLSVGLGESIPAPVRDAYTSESRAEVLAGQYATTGIRATGKGSVRWPFAGQAAVSSPYGPRTPICSGSVCTDDFHHGTDFLPGDGAPIFAIANGVVIGHSQEGSDLGNYVTIQHKIGRDVVTSIYGHLQAGSSPLVVGQTVRVGDFVGLVGATGIATGPHLHLGIAVNGVETDPLVWMIAHVK